MQLGNFRLSGQQLQLGVLGGNRFTLVLREAYPRDPALLQAPLQALSRSGFINYFGLQRFGNGAVPTHRQV